MSLLFNMLSRFVVAFLPRSKHLWISRTDFRSCQTTIKFRIYYINIISIMHLFPVRSGSHKGRGKLFFVLILSSLLAVSTHSVIISWINRILQIYNFDYLKLVIFHFAGLKTQIKHLESPREWAVIPVSDRPRDIKYFFKGSQMLNFPSVSRIIHQLDLH